MPTRTVIDAFFGFILTGGAGACGAGVLVAATVGMVAVDVAAAGASCAGVAVGLDDGGAMVCTAVGAGSPELSITGAIDTSMSTRTRAADIQPDLRPSGEILYQVLSAVRPVTMKLAPAAIYVKREPCLPGKVITQVGDTTVSAAFRGSSGTGFGVGVAVGDGVMVDVAVDVGVEVDVGVGVEVGGTAVAVSTGVGVVGADNVDIAKAAAFGSTSAFRT